MASSVIKARTETYEFANLTLSDGLLYVQSATDVKHISNVQLYDSTSSNYVMCLYRPTSSGYLVIIPISDAMTKLQNDHTYKAIITWSY